jgi:hypothetical protein
VRLKLLESVDRIVDEREAGALAATELGAETEDGYLILLCLVEFAKLASELVLGHVGAIGVEDIAGKHHGQQPHHPKHLRESTQPDFLPVS